MNALDNNIAMAKEQVLALRHTLAIDSIHLNFTSKQVLRNELKILELWLRSLGVVVTEGGDDEASPIDSGYDSNSVSGVRY